MAKRVQKVFYMKSNEIKDLIDKFLAKKSDITHRSESRIIEEYIIVGLCRDFPNEEQIQQLKEELTHRYSFIDNEIIDVNGLISVK